MRISPSHATSQGRDQIALSRRAILVAASVAPTLAVARGRSPETSYAALVAEQAAKGGFIPRASVHLDGLTAERAYQVQASLVGRRLRNDAAIGIKGGALTPAAQAALGLDGPVTGVLFRSGRIEPGGNVERRRFRRLLVEAEVGFELAQTVTAPLANLGALKHQIAAIRPCIELPDDSFAERGATGADLIAANVMSASFIAGPRFAPETPVSDLQVSVSRDGAQVHRGAATDAFPNPWAALLRLVNDSVSRRGPLAGGSLVITGALGGAFAGLPGAYEAAFGPLGSLSFRVT